MENNDVLEQNELDNSNFAENTANVDQLAGLTPLERLTYYVPEVSSIDKGKSSETPRKVFLVLNATFLCIFALVCLVPFFNLLAISLSDAASVDAGEVGLLPVNINSTAYKFLFQKREFWKAFGISIIRVVLGTVISLVVNILAAYPLSRPKKYFKGRQIYVIILIVTMFFNGGIVPSYIIISKLGMMNTIWALVLPTALNAWNIVLLISFFREVPNELIEAAEMDGAGPYHILFKIVLPISLPALATVTLFTVVAHWNSWFDGYMYMNPSKYPLQTYIYQMIDDIKYLSLSNNPADKDLLAQMPDQ